MIFSLVVLLALVSRINAACDNQCSGHGSCLTDDVCACYDNYGVGLSMDSGDCSQRICPFEIAWVDHPNHSGRFHKYAECANRGICNRDSGECECFEGYEGKACARTACPNDCSGHGTCEFIEDTTFAATHNDYNGHYFSIDSQAFPYNNWDTHKTRGCVCDATYGDVDCSKRMCPYGTDVLDVRDNLLVSTKYQVQQLFFLPPDDGTTNQGKTFALTFKSRLNETFTTIPIVMGFTDLNDFVHDIQTALLNLPNRVIDGIQVAASAVSGGYSQLPAMGNGAKAIAVNVTFTGNAVQGPQHLLVVHAYECAAGCTPQITGLNLETRVMPNLLVEQSSNVTEPVLADLNSYECGRRGKCDYATGLCNCFLGYTGDNCNTLTTLV